MSSPLQSALVSPGGSRPPLKALDCGEFDLPDTATESFQLPALQDDTLLPDTVALPGPTPPARAPDTPAPGTHPLFLPGAGRVEIPPSEAAIVDPILLETSPDVAVSTERPVQMTISTPAEADMFAGVMPPGVETAKPTPARPLPALAPAQPNTTVPSRVSTPAPNIPQPSRPDTPLPAVSPADLHPSRQSFPDTATTTDTVSTPASAKAPAFHTATTDTLSAPTQSASGASPVVSSVLSAPPAAPVLTPQPSAPPPVAPPSVAPPPVALPHLPQTLSAISIHSGTTEIQLDPPELGRIVLEFDHGSETRPRLLITTEHPLARAAITERLHQITQMLENQGLRNAELVFADGTEHGAGGRGDRRNEADGYRAPHSTRDDARSAEPTPPRVFAGTAPTTQGGRLDLRL